MALIPVEHEHRISSPTEGEAFFRALQWIGSVSVSCRGFYTTDPARIERLVAAIEPKRDHTISFAEGLLPLAALETLAQAQYHYLDVTTEQSSLRIWPSLRSWVHSRHVIPEPIPDAKVVIDPNGRGYPFDLETQSIPLALRIFRQIGDTTIRQGFINGIAEPTKPILVEFLRQLGATVNAVLHIDVASARALTEVFAGESLDWQNEMLLLDFPEGRIHGFLVTPKVGDEYQTKWQQRVTKALKRAKII